MAFGTVTWHAIPIGIPPSTFRANRLATVTSGALVAFHAGGRRREAACRVCYIADIALRALRQADPFIASRPVTRWHAAPGLWVMAKALGTLRLVVALAETDRINVAALRAIGHACLPLKGVDHSRHAGTIAAWLILIRRTVISIVEITMIALGAVGQWNLVVAHRAAMITRGQAHAGVARVSREVAGAGRHTRVPVNLLTRRATGFGGA